MTEEIEKAQKRVEQELTRLKTDKGKVQHVGSESLHRVFPGHGFFSVLFRRYPVALVPPEPLKSSNLVIVPEEGGRPRLITETRDLKTFFEDNVKPVRDPERAKDVVRAWLQSSTVLHQDGYYKFSLSEDSVQVSKEKERMKAVGHCVVMAGGNGTIAVVVEVDEAGKLTRIDQTVKLRRGPRPICQATKLLDRDPIVRRMAEEDLRIMGRAARGYLDEQRSRATPELKQAIDRIWERICEDDQ